jgi:hypothetical protein
MDQGGAGGVQNETLDRSLVNPCVRTKPPPVDTRMKKEAAERSKDVHPNKIYELRALVVRRARGHSPAPNTHRGGGQRGHAPV